VKSQFLTRYKIVVMVNKIGSVPMPNKYGFPRRACLDEMTPAEIVIRNALIEVEKLPGDVRLTDAVNLLDAARESVADYVDGIEKRRTVTVIEGK
jgi:hypothetical protein